MRGIANEKRGMPGMFVEGDLGDARRVSSWLRILEAHASRANRGEGQ